MYFSGYGWVMEQGVSRLLLKEKRRRRLMFGVVTLGVAIIAISSRSERAMFGAGLPMPGVFATISTPMSGTPRVSLRDRDPSAFFAGLDRGVKDPVGPLDSGTIGPIDNALLFVGPGDGLPPGRLDPPGFIDGPQIFGDPVPYREPEMSDPPYFPPQKKPETTSTGGGGSGGSSGGGSSGGGGGSSGGSSGSSGGTSTGGSSGSSGGTDGGSSGGDTSTGGGSSGGSSGGLVDPPPPPHTGVPEPATWALMITGFLGIGVLMRRRRSAEQKETAPSVNS